MIEMSDVIALITTSGSAFAQAVAATVTDPTPLDTGTSIVVNFFAALPPTIAAITAAIIAWRASSKQDVNSAKADRAVVTAEKVAEKAENVAGKANQVADQVAEVADAIRMSTAAEDIERTKKAISDIQALINAGNAEVKAMIVEVVKNCCGKELREVVEETKADVLKRIELARQAAEAAENAAKAKPKRKRRSRR